MYRTTGINCDARYPISSPPTPNPNQPSMIDKQELITLATITALDINRYRRSRFASAASAPPIPLLKVETGKSHIQRASGRIESNPTGKNAKAMATSNDIPETRAVAQKQT